MLSKESRTVFKIAKKPPEKKVAYFDLKKQLGWDFDQVKSAGDQLVKLGYATEKYYSPMPGSNVLWGIVLTEEGRNSRKYFWVRITSFLFRSIVVPIIVAFFTAIVTAYVTTKIISG